jgi:hypothetical protein
MLFIGALPGSVALIARSRGTDVGWTLPWLSLAIPFAVLALTEQTKAVLYASLIVPSLCLSLAYGLDAAIRVTFSAGRWAAVSEVLKVVIAVLIIVMIGEGFRGYLFSTRESARVTPYLEVGRRIASFMPEEGPVLGAWRWWWAVGNRSYFAVNGLWWSSQRVSAGGAHLPLREEVETKRARYLIVDRDFQADLDRTVSAYRSNAVRFIDECSSVVGVINDVTYGRIEVRRVSCPAGALSNVSE